MGLASQIVNLIHSLKDSDIEALPPAARRRFAAVCRHAAAVAERTEQDRAPKAGVLADLRQGERGE